jgi:ketosteroid isomerase-like protein
MGKRMPTTSRQKTGPAARKTCSILGLAIAIALTSCSWRAGSQRRQAEPAAADPAARSPAEREVLDAEQAWTRAVVNGDADGFASFLADEYVELTSGGRYLEKAALIGPVRTGTARYSAIELRDLRVRFPRPDVAVVTGVMLTTRSDRQDSTQRNMFINTWVRVGERWQCVAGGLVRASTPAS